LRLEHRDERAQRLAAMADGVLLGAGELCGAAALTPRGQVPRAMSGVWSPTLRTKTMTHW